MLCDCYINVILLDIDYLLLLWHTLHSLIVEQHKIVVFYTATHISSIHPFSISIYISSCDNEKDNVNTYVDDGNSYPNHPAIDYASVYQ